MAELNIYNAIVFAGGSPPMADPSAPLDEILHELIERYSLQGEDIIIDLVGNAIARLAEQYRREPVS